MLSQIYIYISYNFFMHWSVDVLAIVNNAAMNMGMQVAL